MFHLLHFNTGPFSIYGTGVSLYGYRPVDQERYSVTRWVTILWLPILPLSTWVIRPIRSNFINLGAAMGSSHKFDVVERLRLDVGSVLRTYLTGYFVLIVAVAPLAAVLAFSNHHRGLKPGPVEIVLWFVSVIWMLLPIWILDHRQEKIYEEAEKKVPKGRSTGTLPEGRNPELIQSPAERSPTAPTTGVTTEGAWVLTIFFVVAGSLFAYFGGGRYLDGIVPVRWVGYFLIAFGLFWLFVFYGPIQPGGKSPS